MSVCVCEGEGMGGVMGCLRVCMSMSGCEYVCVGVRMCICFCVSNDEIDEKIRLENVIRSNFYVKDKNAISIKNGWSKGKTLFAHKHDQKSILPLKIAKALFL